MNYFGHAAVANLRTASSRFVLGAMLPDLVMMAGVAAPRTFLDQDLNLGLLFHIETDALFHNTRAFIELNRRALSDLRARGVSRGPARACAHIGVEMWIDAELAKDDDTHFAYRSALQQIAHSRHVLLPLPEEESERAVQLCEHLLTAGRGVFQPSAERFAFRLARTLSTRPPLAPSAEELRVIADYLSTFTDASERCAELMEELSPLWKTRAAALT
jgi:hypothetical protein